MNPALSLCKISHAYGRRRVLNDLSLEISAGETVALLGGNGSGKSTLLRIAAGVLNASQGRVVHSALCGYVAQKFALYEDLSVESNIRFFAQACGVESRSLTEVVEVALDRFDLGERRSQRAGELSQGWRQRLKLAVALAHKPAVLLLDEATAGIDPISRAELWPMLSAQTRDGMAILFATHHLDEAEQCDRIVFLREGSVVLSGSPTSIRHEAGRLTGSHPTLAEALLTFLGGACR